MPKVLMMVVRIITMGLFDLARKGIEKRRRRKAVERMKRINAKRRADMAKNRAMGPADPPPRYDEVFRKGTEWLNKQ